MRTALSTAIIYILCMFFSIPAFASNTESWKNADRSTRGFAVDLARKAFDSYVLRHQVISAPRNLPPLLRVRAPVFVSAMRNFAPRCCMGSLYPNETNVAEEIIASAVAAAGRDLRFPPVKPSELKQLTLIVSILDTPKMIDSSQAHRLDPVTTGLAVECDGRCGVVLSGETRLVSRMIEWARIRAGAAPASRVHYFEIEDVRIVERAAQNGAPQTERE